MGELYNYFKDKYSKKSQTVEDILHRTKVKNALIEISEKLNSGDVLEIEVLPNDLVYIPVVIEEEPLKSTIQVEQITPSLFNIRLIDIDMGDF